MCRISYVVCRMSGDIFSIRMPIAGSKKYTSHRIIRMSAEPRSRRAVARIVRLRALLKDLQLDGLLVTGIHNVRYLSGFTGSSALCLVTGREALFYTDFRYRLQAEQEVREFDVTTVPGGKIFEAAGRASRRLRLVRIGFEEERLSVADHRRLRRVLPPSVRLVALPSPVETLRRRKERGEVRLLARLARLADGILRDVIFGVAPGTTEADIAVKIDRLARIAGCDGVSFPPIIASGARGAMPHHRSSGCRLPRCGPLVIDLGVRGGGYNSDLTRTFHLGRVTRRFRETYSAVLEAQQVALKAIRPGAVAGDVDKAARDVISAAGYGEMFGHGLGHGIGMEVHEAPRLGPGSGDVLEEGMVVTVEPGIYVQGWGGVRIEDMVLVVKGGCRLLTSSPKAMGDILK